MNTQVTRPGHLLPGWGQGLTDQETSELMLWAVEAEARTCTWLDRIMFGAIGACIGSGALWLGLLIAAS